MGYISGMIVTIDGPSGTGKTTTARAVARKLGFTYLDTGAMYRAFAWFMLARELKIEESGVTLELLNQFDFRIEARGEERRYFVENHDISQEIRQPDVTAASSEVAKYRIVRQHIVHLQREYAKSRDIVIEGRDLGSVVFPHAELKIFLTASARVRAERRYAEMCEKYPEAAAKTSVDQIMQAQEQRDENDTTRRISPLVCADDAKTIDTSNLTIDQVVERIVDYAKQVNERYNIFYSALYFSVRFVISLFLRLFFRFKVYGKENVGDGAAIIAANHASFLDPPVMGLMCPKELHFLARASLFRHFLFGKLIRMLHAHPIGGTVSDVAMFHEVEKLVLQGKKVVMFPEGRRSRNGKIMPFKRGVGMIVERTHVKVIPAYIGGTYRAWGRNMKFPRIFKRITIVFGKPLTFDRIEHESHKEYQENVAKAVQEAVEDLRKTHD